MSDDRGGKRKLFLAYARADDQPFVRRLYRDLQKRGYAPGWTYTTWPAGASQRLER